MKKNLILFMSVFLGACNPFSAFKPDSQTLVKRGWAKNKPKPLPDALYCYHTLGDYVCYSRPLQGGEERMRGNYDHLMPIPDDKTWLEKALEKEGESDIFPKEQALPY